MEFLKLYNLLVEKEKDDEKSAVKSDDTFEAPESQDDKEKEEPNFDKIAKDDEEARDEETVKDENDPFAKLGKAAGLALGRKLFGTQKSKAAAEKAIKIGLERKVGVANIPSWVWTQMIPDDLEGESREKHRETQKANYSKNLEAAAGEGGEENKEDEPTDAQDGAQADVNDNDKVEAEPSLDDIKKDQEVSKEIDSLTDELEASGEEITPDMVDDLVSDIKNDKTREAKKEEVKRKLSTIKKKKKAEKDAESAANKEEEDDSKTQSKAADFKLN